jgi:protein tyrosine/serine phosphatase
MAAAAGVVFVASLFAWAWGSAPINLRERIFPKNLAEVEGGWLYRSGQIRPNLIEGTLRDLKIDLIVDLSYDLGGRDASQIAERVAAEKLGIEVQRFPMSGTGIGSVENYVGAIAAIERGRRESKRVLLHCRAGDKRTGGVLAAYQILVKGMSVADAKVELERFKPYRPGESQLLGFLDEKLPEIGQGLIAAGVIQRLPDPLPTFASL